MKTKFNLFLLFTLSLLLIGVGAACSSSKKSKNKATATKPASQSNTDTGSGATTPTPSAEATLELEKGEGIQFLKSSQLMPVLEEANRRNMPVFVEFWAPWCGPCKTLEREVLSTLEVSDFVNKNFLSVRFNLDAEDSKAVAQLYDAGKLPTMLFLDKKGVELGRIVGTTTPGRFIRAGADALAKK